MFPKRLRRLAERSRMLDRRSVDSKNDCSIFSYDYSLTIFLLVSTYLTIYCISSSLSSLFLPLVNPPLLLPPLTLPPAPASIKNNCALLFFFYRLYLFVGIASFSSPDKSSSQASVPRRRVFSLKDCFSREVWLGMAGPPP